MDKKQHNRLVIIGNGFDLALGLKTRYTDFILHYIREAIIDCYYDSDNVIERPLIVVTRKFKLESNSAMKEVAKIEECKNLKEINPIIKNYISITYKYGFFKKICSDEYINWIDIESYYFKKLEEIYREYQSGTVDNDRVLALEHMADVNNCMKVIESELHDYLVEEQKRVAINYRKSHLSYLFDEPFSVIEDRMPKDRDLLKVKGLSGAPSHVLFLNFNYTRCVSKFLFQKSPMNGSVISIHGMTGDPSNQIIFGYGDDTGRLYKELELLEENEFLDRIKSFQYPKTHNYHELLFFLELHKYEVFIYGHSCGLSDKTMLQTIFEHDNCVAIKNYHHAGEKSDFKKRIAISRHFSDKPKMRERLLPFDKFASINSISN